MRRPNAGGVLWDLFLITAVLLGGWVAWRSRSRWWPAASSWVRREPSASAPGVSADLTDRCARFQAGALPMLASSGVTDKNLLKNFNEEKSVDGVTWLESTIVVRRPPKFKEGAFLRPFLTAVSEAGLSVMEDRREKGEWTLSCGDRERVFQRFVFVN